MAKTVPLDAPTLAWARGRFERYYGATPVAPPSRLARREFAAFPFGETTGMRRHATLPTEEELARYLQELVPRHVYYSSAYYRLPAEPTMAAKGWLGADLIFDLDSDHLRGAADLDYAGQLALVKRRLLDLVDDFLVRDFGIDTARTSFVFSGGRGYHVHIPDERFLGLSSPERREIVDYVLGSGFDPTAAIEEHREDVRAGRTLGSAEADDAEAPRRDRPARTIRLAPVDAPGWRGRTTRAVLGVLSRWERDGAKQAAKELEGWGVPPDKAGRWARLLLGDGRAAKIRRTLALDVFGKGDAPKEFLAAVVRGAAVEVQAETDAPVTTDIHRLIRLPGSLHGGTGLRVVPLTREAVDGFDPFRDAMPEETAVGEATPVTFLEDVAYPFPAGRLRGTAGSTDELPTGQALFLVLRGEAALRPSPAA
jgi:DNA primase small subunit